jgi:lysophospholipase L1-like esterase
MAIIFDKNKRFLFIGGAITESGRFHDIEGVGHGFVRHIRDYLRARHPATAPVIINRGRSDSISDIASWWQQDVLAEQPDVVSLLIDVPDPSRQLPNEVTDISIENLCGLYRQLFEQTQVRLPRCEIVLCEPAAIWSDKPVEADDMLRRYRKALSAINGNFFGRPLVPVHSAFIFAQRTRPDLRWVEEDGQPTSAGHMLIATTWLEENGLAPRAVG